MGQVIDQRKGFDGRMVGVENEEGRQGSRGKGGLQGGDRVWNSGRE